MLVKVKKFKEQNLITETEIGIYGNFDTGITEVHPVHNDLQPLRTSSYLSYELLDRGGYFLVAKDRGLIFS